MTAPADTLVDRLDHLADVHSDNHPMTAGMVREAAARIRELEAALRQIGKYPLSRHDELSPATIRAIAQAALLESK